MNSNGIALFDAAHAWLVSDNNQILADYNGNGELGIEDLNLQSQGMKDGDLAFDLNGMDL
ncbi:MAG: hypothetical protein KDB27_22525 [Planctomycetales bacterium]|nr:hypothetical protein [Planctomycetales bacterium]